MVYRCIYFAMQNISCLPDIIYISENSNIAKVACQLASMYYWMIGQTMVYIYMHIRNQLKKSDKLTNII